MEKIIGPLYSEEIPGDGTITLPIQPVVQTRDACVTACVRAVLAGMNYSYDEELRNLLLPHIAPPEKNPHRNPEYIRSTGFMEVLLDKGHYIGLHSFSKEGYKNNIVTTVPNIDYTNEEFTLESFTQFIKMHLLAKRYLLPWLNNQLYDPSIVREYDQHVVVIHRINEKNKTVGIMDPDMFLTEEEQQYRRLYDYPIENLYNALFRKESSRNWEQVIVIGRREN